MKTFNLFFCLIFLISAVLQYNDPDPFLWILIYLYGAACCLLAIRNVFRPQAYTAGIILYLAYAIYLFFNKTGVLSWFYDHDAENIVQSMKATKPWIEETREFGGLILLIIALLTNLIYYRRKQQQNSKY